MIFVEKKTFKSKCLFVCLFECVNGETSAYEIDDIAHNTNCMRKKNLVFFNTNL